MAAEKSAEAPAYDPVGAIEAKRFRHTLFFPLALARDGKKGGNCKPARDLVEALANALPGSGVWRELEELVAHCEPSLDERGASPGKLHPRSSVASRSHGWTLADEEVAADRYQETVYFHRFVQRFLYGDDVSSGASGEYVSSPPMRVFRRGDITRVMVELASVNSFDAEEEKRANARWKEEVVAGRQPRVSSIGRLSTRAIALEVETVNLHLFDAGVAILAITVAAKRGKDGAIEQIVAEDGAERPAKLADLLDLIERFRRVYIPYWAKFAVGATADHLRLLVFAEGVPSSVTWAKTDGSALTAQAPSRADVAKAFVAGFPHGVPELLPWWKDLLPDALVIRGTSQPEKGLPEWRFVADERMATTTFLSVPNIARLSEAAWAQLCFCDKGGDSKPYGGSFLEDFDQLHAYDRFSSWGTRYVMCSYNFACAVTENNFANITETHMRRHYFQIMLVAQFQAAALLAFSNWVSEAMEAYAKPGANETDTENLRRSLHAIELEFQAFVHRYWFTGVSNQVQPTELYAKLRKLLLLDDWFKEVLTEMETSRAFLRDQEQERASRSAEQLSMLAGLGLLVALPASVLGMNMFLGDRHWLSDALASLTFLPGAANCAKPENISGFAQVGWTALIVAIFAGLFWLFIGQMFVGGDGATRRLRMIVGWTWSVGVVVGLVCFYAFPVCVPK